MYVTLCVKQNTGTMCRTFPVEALGEGEALEIPSTADFRFRAHSPTAGGV